MSLEQSMPICTQCGAILREGAFFCVDCGTPISQREHVKINRHDISSISTEKSEDKLLDVFLVNLKQSLRCAIEQQHDDSNSRLWWDTDCASMFNNDNDKMDLFLESEESAIIGNAIASMTNCIFWADNGEEVFTSTTNDGKAHLMLNLSFEEIPENKETISKIINSSIYNKFQHARIKNKFCRFHYFFIDCQEDIEAMTQIFKVLITEVFELKLAYEWHFETFLHQTKKEYQDDCIKEAKSLKYERITN